MKYETSGKAGSPTWPLALFVVAIAGLVAEPAVAGAPAWLDRLSLATTGSPLAPQHAVVLAVAVVVAARGVLLRRRAAWYGLLSVVLMGVLAVLTGDDEPWHLPALAFAAGGLWRSRGEFIVLPHPARVRTALRTGAILVIAAAATSVLLGGVSIRSIGPDLVSGFGGSGADIDGASWLPGTLAWTGAAGLLAIVLILLAPAPAPPPGDDTERGRVAGLVAHPGSDTLAPFALRRDRSYVFSPDRRAAVGYRVLFGVAVVGGDPIGDPRSYAGAIGAFLELCRHTGWRPAVLGASAARLGSWSGMRSIGFGDEVLIRPAGFTLSGRQMRNVRQAVQRTRNFEVKTEILAEDELTDALRAELLAVASSALAGVAERGFSMNLDELLTGYHPGGLIAVAYAQDGRAIAFQRYATTGSGLSLDAMRRAPDAANGINERLIVDVIEYARERGIAVVSLNFAAFRELLDSADRNVLEKLGYQALHVFDPWIAVESLYLFNRKFRPEYLPRSVVFRSWVDIGWVAVALLTLEFGRSGPATAPEPALAPEPYARRL